MGVRSMFYWAIGILPFKDGPLAPVRGTEVIFGNSLPLLVLVLFGLRFLLKQLGHHLRNWLYL